MKKQTRDTFPLTIKKGHAVVKIYEVTNRKRKNRDGEAYKIYTVSYVGPKGRTRRDFANLDEAKAEANIIARSIAGFDAQRLNLNGDDARDYQQARDTIRATGLRAAFSRARVRESVRDSWAARTSSKRRATTRNTSTLICRK